MWFNEETGKWEKYGTSPIPDAYWKFVPNNQPERSKREDIHVAQIRDPSEDHVCVHIGMMRCSEHDSNAVRDK